MVGFDSHLLNLSNDLTDSKSNFELLTDRIIEMGFDSVIYTFYPKPMYNDLKLQPVLQYSDKCSDFIKYYLEHGYGNHDFVLRLAMSGVLGYIDWVKTADKIKLTDMEKEVMDVRSSVFGIKNGISFPSFYSTFAIAGLALLSSKDRDEFDKIKKDNLDELSDLAKSYHTTVMMTDLKNSFISPMLAKFNSNKKMVMKFLLSGQPLKRISESNNISVNYAEKIVREIRQDFGGVSKSELMYLCGMLNIENYLYHEQEILSDDKSTQLNPLS